MLNLADGNPNLLEGGLINWVKRRRLATVLKDIQQYQQKPYCLEAVPFIQEFLLKRETLDEDECYKLSLQRETRTPEKEQKRKTTFFKKKDKPAAPQVPLMVSCLTISERHSDRSKEGWSSKGRGDRRR